jgi:hypothetical protein
VTNLDEDDSDSSDDPIWYWIGYANGFAFVLLLTCFLTFNILLENWFSRIFPRFVFCLLIYQFLYVFGYFVEVGLELRQCLLSFSWSHLRV